MIVSNPTGMQQKKKRKKKARSSSKIYDLMRKRSFCNYEIQRSDLTHELGYNQNVLYTRTLSAGTARPGRDPPPPWRVRVRSSPPPLRPLPMEEGDKPQLGGRKFTASWDRSCRSDPSRAVLQHFHLRLMNLRFNLQKHLSWRTRISDF